MFWRLEAQSKPEEHSRPLVIGQQDALLALGFQYGFQLRLVKLDDLLLPAMDQTRQDGKQEVLRLKNEAHGVLRTLNQRTSSSMKFAMAVVNRPNSAVAEIRQLQAIEALTDRLNTLTLPI